VNAVIGFRPRALMVGLGRFVVAVVARTMITLMAGVVGLALFFGLGLGGSYVTARVVSARSAAADPAPSGSDGARSTVAGRAAPAPTGAVATVAGP
jgi:hypothetical protein